jgi:hypothetical protein
MSQVHCALVTGWAPSSFLLRLNPLIKWMLRVIRHNLGPDKTYHVFAILHALRKLCLKIRYRSDVFFLELGYRFRLCKIFWGFDNRYDDCCCLRDKGRKNADYCRIGNFRVAHQYRKASRHRANVAKQQRVNYVLFKRDHLSLPNTASEPRR